MHPDDLSNGAQLITHIEFVKHGAPDFPWCTLFVEVSGVLQEDMSESGTAPAQRCQRSAVICSCCRGPNRTIPTQLGLYSQQLIAQLSIMCASETGCVASLLLCLVVLQGA